MVFVPEFRAREGKDPWAHRKGEPRPLALFWLVYLMVSAAATIFAAYTSWHYPSQWQFIYACRALYVMVALGACVLWPMMRLSQEFPHRPARATLLDLLVLTAPAWAALMPAPLLTRWPVSIAIALSSSMTAWILLAAAWVLMAYRWPGHVARTLSMFVIIGVVLAGPASVVLFRVPDWWLWLSPFTAVFEITHSVPAVAPTMTRDEWLLALAPAGAALVLLVLALALPHPGRQPQPLH